MNSSLLEKLPMTVLSQQIKQTSVIPVMTSTWPVVFSVMVADAIANIQAKYYIQFVDWFFTGFKVGINNKEEKKKFIRVG